MIIMKCNVCGKEFDLWDNQENFCFHHKVGYGSKFDGEEIQLDLCCDCFDKIIEGVANKCAINPFKSGSVDME